MSNVSGVIKSIQDVMRKDVGVDGDAQRISQLVWLFFLKILDDREDELELTEDDYKSPLPEKLRWRNWAKDSEGITGDTLLNFVNNELFPALKNELKVEGADNKRALVIKNVFEDAYNYMKSGTLLRQVINKVCEINFNASNDRHTFGGIYEQILKDLQSAGNAGEFYTPRAVTTFIVDRIAPKLEETVLDPACGTGGFLTNVIEYKRKHFVKSQAEEEILQKTIFGVEKKAMPHMLCTTNMILHGIDVPINIKHDNTLARPYRDYSSADRVNVIVTNPPFGGMEEDGIENNFPATYRTRSTAELFLTLIIHILKNEGRAAVVLPDGFLLGEGIQTRIKERLLTECNLHTIVRLPNGVFNPYTGIKTNILFFTKGKPTEHIWYYEHTYPKGVINYNKTKPMQFEEFHTEIDWWGKEENGFVYRVENEQAWKVSVKDIIENNYNLDIKNPHIGEQIKHDVHELLTKYNNEQNEIDKLHSRLKNILAEASINEASWEFIVKHFKTLFPTIDSIIQLKQMIHQLAIMGKLVRQDAKDEPAKELIKRIEKEKEILFKEGKIKKRVAFTEIGANQKAFALPKGWEWCKLDDIGYTNIGLTYSPSDISNSGIIVLRLSNIQNGEIELTDIVRVEKNVNDNVIVKNGDLLICARNGSKKLVGKCAIIKNLPEKMAFGAFMAIYRSSFNEYVRIFIESPFYRRNLEGVSTTTINQITQDNLKNTFIPLPLYISVKLCPPFEEQQRIVSKVRELNSLCENLTDRILKAKDLQVFLSQTIFEDSVL